MDVASIAGLAMGLLSFLSGGVLWYKGSVEKRYAAQRDFGHLKNNYRQMSEAIATQAKDVDSRFDSLDDQLKEIKMMIQFKVGDKSGRG